jgi:hypothetical protein
LKRHISLVTNSSFSIKNDTKNNLTLQRNILSGGKTATSLFGHKKNNQ